MDHKSKKHNIFTLCTSTECNDWANRLLKRTVQLITEKTIGDSIKSIILTGSFSRGEASIVKYSNAYSLAGDIEFLLVASNGYSLSFLRKKSDRLKSDIATQLSREFNTSIDVDLGFVGTDYFTHKIQPSIFSYDLVRNGKTVAGENLFPKRPLFTRVDIPKEDALELLLNRAIELMELKNGQVKEEVLTYHYVKIILDMAGSVLAFSGNYISPYQKRYDAMLELVTGELWQKNPIPASAFLDVLEQATTIKMNGASVIDGQYSPSVWDENAIERWLGQLIVSEMISLFDEQKLSTKALLKRYAAAERKVLVMRCWVKYLCHPLRPPKAMSYFHLIHYFIKCSPRRLIYSAALKCYLQQNDITSELFRSVGKDLAVFRLGRGRKSYIEEVILLWKSFIRQN